LHAGAQGRVRRMNRVLADKVVWHRRGARSLYVGSLLASSDDVRFTGRDPSSGIVISLRIPQAEIVRVRASEPDESSSGEQWVVLELASPGDLLLRGVGLEHLQSRTLAQRLSGLKRCALAAAAAL